LLKAVGADAVNQALKSVIIANRTFIKQGQIARIFPAFETLGREEDEKTQSGIVLQLEISRV
jgi:stage V sporulation protein SpoVS